MQKISIAGRGAFFIREYRISDMSRVLALWNMAFGKVMPPRLWQWKYHDNPFGFRILLCVNELDEPVVMYGGIPYRTRWLNRTVEVIHLMDVMSHPEYRKTGLFIEIGRVFFEHFAGPDRCALVYGFPGKYHFDIGKKYLGYREITPGVAYLRAVLPGAIGLAPKPFDPLTPVSPDDEALDDLWQSVENSYPLSVQRNATFARWRYGGYPENPYELWGYRSRQQGALTACVVLKLAPGRAGIVDLIMPDSLDIAGRVVERLAENLSARGIGYLETWLPEGHFLCRHLGACGFERLPEPTGIIPTAKTFCPSMPFERVCENIYYTMADGDLV